MLILPNVVISSTGSCGDSTTPPQISQVGVSRNGDWSFGSSTSGCWFNLNFRPATTPKLMSDSAVTLKVFFRDLFYVYKCLAYMYVCTLCVCLVSTEIRQRQGFGSSQIEVVDGCEPPCGCWELKLSARITNALNR